MATSRAAIRYATAVYDLASDQKQEDTVLGDMKDVHATLTGSKELRLFVQSPIVKSEDKREGLRKIFKDASAVTHGLIDILVTNKRTEILGDVSESFINLYNAKKGVQVAQVTTAVAITDSIKATVLAKVKEMTGSTDITIENTVDDSIIGGFILTVGDMQYNASIANQLGKLKREFSNSL